VTFNATPYVNGIQVGYSIWDGCNQGTQVADAVENTVDVTSYAQYVYSAVATRYGQQVGGYYLGLTRDDVGGLAYLYRQNNYAYETLDSNSVVTGFAGSTWAPVNTSTNSATNTTVGAGAGTGTGTVNFQGLFGGVEKITYVKVAYDSLLGSGFTPRTYNYTIPMITNGVLRTLHATRTITAPDIVFAAGDLTVVRDQVPPPDNYPNPYTRTFTITANPLVTANPATAVLSGVISPQEVITFNDVTSVYVNTSLNFLDSQQFTTFPTLLWGSFDGTTNAPIIYPSSSSIASLSQEILNGAATTVSLGIYNPVSTNTTTNTVATP
jgi:hypothetical protein